MLTIPAVRVASNGEHVVKYVSITKKKKEEYLRIFDHNLGKSNANFRISKCDLTIVLYTSQNY